MKSKFILKTVTVVAFSLFMGFFSCKKKEKDPPATINYGTPTAVGTPTGVSNSATIDASGGTIFSADGRLEIIIPANALSTSTTITIQPVTNTTPGGAGVGYSLTPDGQQFAQAVTLRFHYDSTDVLGTSFLAFGIAYQKADKIWYSFNNAVLDSVAGTESITTTHFSVYGLYEKMRIVPASGSVSTGGTFSVRVVTLETLTDNDGNDELMPLGVMVDYPSPSQVNWTVNGNLQGNQNDGTLFYSTGTIFNIYTAPQSASNMSVNPAAVTAMVSGVTNAGASQISLSSLVRVKRPYYVDVHFKGTNIQGYACTFNFADYGSFIFNYNDDNTIHAFDFTNTSGTFDSLKIQTGYPCTITPTSNGNLLNITTIDGIVQNGNIYLIINSLGDKPSFSHDCSGTILPFPGDPYGGSYHMPSFPIDNNPHTLLYNLNPGELITVTVTPL